MIHFFKRIKWKTEVSVTAFFLIVITVIVIDSVIDSLFYQATQCYAKFKLCWRKVGHVPSLQINYWQRKAGGNLHISIFFSYLSPLEKILTPKGMSVAMQSPARKNKEKWTFLWFFAHLFVSLQTDEEKSCLDLHDRYGAAGGDNHRWGMLYAGLFAGAWPDAGEYGLVLQAVVYGLSGDEGVDGQSAHKPCAARHDDDDAWWLPSAYLFY